MILADLIERLKQADPDHVPAIGFNNPHSYRGYYDELAFEPAKGVTVREMLACAEGCLGHVFTGYKGGEYRMGPYTEVHLAKWGSSSPGALAVLLDVVLEPSHSQEPSE